MTRTRRKAVLSGAPLKTLALLGAMIGALQAAPVLADMASADFDTLDKRAFALGEINGYLSLCGQADPLRHRATIADEATAAGASESQLQALVYAFNKGLSAGATAAPLQFNGCAKKFFDYLQQKNDALGDLERQRPGHVPKN
jgi:predicted secreted protein